MLISSNHITTSFAGLVPKKQYTGVILKLTKSDKEKIADLQKELAIYECEMYKLSKFNKKRSNMTPNEFDTYRDKTWNADFNIRVIKDEIAKIKRNRLAKQIEKEAKKNNK